MTKVSHNGSGLKQIAFTDCVSDEHIGKSIADARDTSRGESQKLGSRPVSIPTEFPTLEVYKRTRDEYLQTFINIPLVDLSRAVAPFGGLLVEACVRRTPGVPSGGRSLPSSLDTRGQPDAASESVAITDKKSLADKRRWSQQQALGAMKEVLATGMLMGLPVEEYNPDAIGIIAGWHARLGGCGDQLHLMGCPDGHVAKLVVECCNTPICSYEESRRSARWMTRARGLMSSLKEGASFGALRKRLEKQGIALAAMSHPPHDRARMGWKMLTVSLRGNGNLAQDIDEALTYRKVLARRLRDHHGVIAAIGSLDVGDNGHPHIHFLIYSPYIPRGQIQQWQKARDCTVPGCKHPADDRCPTCREAGVDCDHDHPDGRVRCNGSWVVNIKFAYSPDDVVKYSVSPSSKGHTDTADHAALRLAVYVVAHKRHRTETYGLAKLKSFDASVELAQDDVDHCKCCGQPLVLIAVGERRSDHYLWHPPPNSQLPTRAPLGGTYT